MCYPKQRICRCCELPRWIYARGLCKPCYQRPGVLERFGPLRNTNVRRPEGARQKLAHDPTLALPRPPACPEWCVHHLRDGECPECEREQRQRAGSVATAAFADEEGGRLDE